MVTTQVPSGDGEKYEGFPGGRQAKKSELWANRQKEQAVISGGVRLRNLKWEPYRDGIMKASVPAGLTTDQLFVNCLIYLSGRVEKQTAPVQIQLSWDITVRHCSLYDVPRAGINIGDGCWGGHVIEMDYNLIHRAGLKGPEPAVKLAQQSQRDANSIVAEAMFVAPATGDFRVKAGSPALKLGFVNFPMDQVGVQKPELRAIARTPQLPDKTLSGEVQLK